MSSGGVVTPMAHSHGPLSRTNTAPVFQTRTTSTSNGLPGIGQTMSHSSRSSQLSGQTAFTSASTTSLSSMSSSATLVTPPQMAAPNGGQIVATNNIINQRADASRSLYQICVNLRQRLAQVPNFHTHLTDSDSEDEGEDMDPVSSLWRCLRKGTPLLTIYNSLQPPEPLLIDENISEAKRPKVAAFKFVAQCLQGDLQIQAGDCFSLQDLFGDDTTGFVKVTQIINTVLDVAESRGLLLAPMMDNSVPEGVDGAGKVMVYRDHVVKELVDTERKYVQDLENLHELKKVVEQKGVIPGDVVHDIFLNINAILDFQRRFLIKIETTNQQPDEAQRWDLPFTNYEEAFGIYQPFIANQRKAAAIARKEFDKIALADHPVVVDFNTLDGFLLKPMQRLVKYPLLLKDLRDKCGADAVTKEQLHTGVEASNRVLFHANSAVDRELRAEALEDLCSRVDDWKNHQVMHFGELLLHGHFPVVTGKSDVQKEVRPFFESADSSASVNSLRIKVDSGRKALMSSLRPSNSPRSSKDSDKLADDVLRVLESDTEEDGARADERRLSAGLPFNREKNDFRGGKTFVQWGGKMNLKTGLPREVQQQADILGINRPQFEQYTIYLFERILLCCKEVNPNKSKDKLMGAQKDKKDKRDKNRNKEPNKNAKLQLKGRIFMTNVTEVLSLSKQGSGHTVQIFWKGDPGVENFIIRFSNEETMKKWYEGVDGQRKQHANTMTSGSSPDAAPADFTWMRDQAQAIANPYAQQEEDDEEEDYGAPPLSATIPNVPNSTYPGPPVQGMPRNASSTSLRSRSTTGESQASIAGMLRAPPSRFPMALPQPLSLQTQLAPQVPSPGQRNGDSYFSPVAESPASSLSRTSTQSSMFPFPRQGTPQSGWDDQSRYTAPAMPRAPSRGSQTPVDAAYQMNGRQAQRPSLPAMAAQSSQANAAQQRSRSYSTPDINGPNGGRRLPNGSLSNIPTVPSIPAHLQSDYYDAGIPRSQNSSPNGISLRANTQSPGTQRERLGPPSQSQHPNAPQYNRSNTSQVPMHTGESRAMSPPLSGTMPGDADMGLPTQLKVKVNCSPNYVTLVVAFNITYQSLVDRIDAKVGRFSNNAIAQGTMRLKYVDEDGDHVTIESDDDIQIAFQEWRESQKQQYHTGQLGEIELFCSDS